MNKKLLITLSIVLTFVVIYGGYKLVEYLPAMTTVYILVSIIGISLLICVIALVYTMIRDIRNRNSNVVG